MPAIITSACYKCDFQCPNLPTYELCVFLFLGFRTCYTPQGYMTSAVADKPWPFRSSTVTPTSSSAQLSSSAPKSFSKTKSTWQQEENSTATSTTSTDGNSNNKYVCLWNVYFIFMRRLMDYEIDAWHIWILSPDYYVCAFRQVDMNSKNVFGQPRLRASLRDLRSPRRPQKSTIEDDLKKLIIMDPTETPSRDGVNKH